MIALDIAGITAEYNPLHNGHVYHIEETRRQTGCDVVVVAISGDFVQRGEPAILDKWIRAEHALRAGTDLVVEIPTLFCLGDASHYAGASIKILEALGCDHISFGSESGDVRSISDVAGVLASERDAIRSYIAEMTRKGMSYPAARAKAYRKLRSGSVCDEKLEREISILSDPNDILALEYILNMHRAAPLAIKRKGAYHDEPSERQGFDSAERIRSIIKAGGTGSLNSGRNVPEFVSDAFDDHYPVFSDNCFDILKYAVLSADAEAIDECPSGGEGLGNLLKAAVNDADNYSDLILSVKSKRYTYTRISRLCMQVLLNINRHGYDFTGPGYIRVLGHNEKGRKLLSEMRKAYKDNDMQQDMLPVITNINRETEKLSPEALDQLKLDIHASDIYRLISCGDNAGHVEQRMKPVML